MKGFLNEMAILGVKKADLVRISGLSYITIMKIDAGDPTVQDTTVARMRRTVDSIKKQLATVPVLKAGGSHK